MDEYFEIELSDKDTLIGKCLNEVELKKKIDSLIKPTLIKEVKYNTLRDELVESYIRVGVLNNIIKNIELIENKAYVLKLTIGAEKFIFNISLLAGNDEIDGYGISRSLLM